MRKRQQRDIGWGKTTKRLDEEKITKRHKMRKRQQKRHWMRKSQQRETA